VLSQIRITDEDRSAVRALLFEIGRDSSNLEENSFLERATLLAQDLPIGIRKAFYEFKFRESAVGLLITNNPILPEDVGPTPQSHWRSGERRPLSLPQLMHGLYSSLLGEVFGFETQQNGRIFNDLIPVRGERDNSSSGAGNIGLHTEDCFQPFMPDYLGLMCLRNDERAVTTFSSLWQVAIPQNVIAVLFEDRFVAKKHATNPDTKMSSPRFSILFGDPKRPYLRYGSVSFDECTSDMLSAMRFISTALEQNRRDITLAQGDCLYLDNFFAVHGRAAYRPKYGPEGRWFSRLVMTRDLRKTRTFRARPDARIMLKNIY
jgi:L-asparagine oxygenase